MATIHGIFDTYQQNDRLRGIWMKRKAQVEAERLQPYADLLLDNVVWPSLVSKMGIIFSDLEKVCGEAKYASQLSVPIWSFNHVFDYPRGAAPPGGPPHEDALERGDTDAYTVKYIHDLGLRQYLQVEDEDEYPTLYQQTVYSIIKKTNFCQQLAARFGRLYTVSVQNVEANEHTHAGGVRFNSCRVELKLNFFPNGLTEAHQKKVREFKAAEVGRERRTLRAGEKLIFWVGNEDEFIRHGPPMPVARPSCACHFEDDDDE